YDGQTTLVRTPYDASSWPRVSVSATTPAFTALYDAIPAGCTSPATEATLTMRPARCRLNIGVNVRQPRTAPSRLTSTIHCHSSSPATPIRPPPATPALLTSTSSPPQCSSTQSRAAAQSSSDVMSRLNPSVELVETTSSYATSVASTSSPRSRNAWV